MTLLVVIILILVLFGGGGYYWTRPGWRFGGPDIVGVLLLIILLVFALRLVGVY